MDTTARNVAFVEQAYWILLGRSPSVVEIEDQLGSAPAGACLSALPHGLLSTSEFRRRRGSWRTGAPVSTDEAAVETALAAGSASADFVQRTYELLLGRHADESGLRHYASAIDAGTRRLDVVRALALSAEFDARAAAVPVDTRLCELANPAKWDNEEWLAILRSLGLGDDKLSMHRKRYEFTQLLYGCERLGALSERAAFLSVGAGHEPVLYWLANRVERVVAIDLYEGAWQHERAREGDPAVLDDPLRYAPFAFRSDRLAFRRMNARRLEFESDTFDVAYSLSSIEHFGGLPGAIETIREMARVVRPGGLVVVATEYVIGGPPLDETFQPSEIRELLAASGLDLVEPIDEQVYERYRTRPVLLAVTDPYQSPHMTVQVGDTVFTSVIAFLRKTAAPQGGSRGR
ncbi:MAG: methyltransferase domain-containing protein [Vicinamibacterales bacterium]